MQGNIYQHHAIRKKLGRGGAQEESELCHAAMSEAESPFTVVFIMPSMSAILIKDCTKTNSLPNSCDLAPRHLDMALWASFN